MPQYSSGPFMNMSLSGTPGLLAVIFVAFAVLGVFVPTAYFPVLGVAFFVTVILVFVSGIHAQFREPKAPASVLHLSESSSEVPVAPSAPYRVFIVEAFVLVIAVALTFSGLDLAGILDVGGLGQLWLFVAVAFLPAALVALLSFARARRRSPRQAGAA